MLRRGAASAAVLVLSACYYGKVEMAREHRERDERAFEAAKATACFCVSGARCDSDGSGYPMSPYEKPSGTGERCCMSSNCGDGLVCEAHGASAVCAPIDVVAERETVASCAETAPKIWDRASPAGCERAGPDSPGYQSLRWVVGPNIDRIRYVTAADRATLQSIQRGVFLVLSGAGSRALGPSELPPSIRMLRELLGKVGSSVEVVVAEKRCLTKDLVGLLKLRCDERGDGEVAWIRGGEIIATTGYGYHPEKIEPYTERLISLP